MKLPNIIENPFYLCLNTFQFREAVPNLPKKSWITIVFAILEAYVWIERPENFSFEEKRRKLPSFSTINAKNWRRDSFHFKTSEKRKKKEQKSSKKREKNKGIEENLFSDFLYFEGIFVFPKLFLFFSSRFRISGFDEIPELQEILTENKKFLFEKYSIDMDTYPIILNLIKTGE